MTTITHKFTHDDIVRVIANGRIGRVISIGSHWSGKPEDSEVSYYGVQWDKSSTYVVNNEILGGGWFDEDELELCPGCDVPDYLPVRNETWEEQHT